MKKYTVAEFLEIAEYDEELNTYFVEADGKHVAITRRSSTWMQTMNRHIEQGNAIVGIPKRNRQ